MPLRRARSSRWKWLALAGLLLLAAGVAVCTLGWGKVNEIALSWARGNLEKQLQAGVEKLPEIADYDALMRLEVTGTNGWIHVCEGRRMLRELCDRYAEEQDTPFDSARVSDLLKNQAAQSPSELDFMVRETTEIAATCAAAAACDCIVHVDGPDDPYATHATIADYFELLALRVLLHDKDGDCAGADRELSALVMALAKSCTRGSKDWATTWTRVRNDVLEYCVLPMLKTAPSGSPRRALVWDARWHTPGTDPKLWLNNASAIYAFLRKEMDNGRIANVFDGDPWEPKSFPGLDLRNIPGLSELVEVVVENALAARRGELDLRNPEWVSSYHFEFDNGWHPVNGVVGCGHETMNGLADEISREDRLWKQIEAIPAQP